MSEARAGRGHIWRFQEGCPTEWFSVSKGVRWEPQEARAAEARFGDFVRGSGLKDFVLRESVRSERQDAPAGPKPDLEVS